MRKSNRPLSNSLSIEACTGVCLGEADFFFFFFRRRLIVAVYSGFSSPFAIAVVDVQACHVVRALSIEAFSLFVQGHVRLFRSR